MSALPEEHCPTHTVPGRTPWRAEGGGECKRQGSHRLTRACAALGARLVGARGWQVTTVRLGDRPGVRVASGCRLGVRVVVDALLLTP